MRFVWAFATAFLLCLHAAATPKSHTVTLGRPMLAKLMVGAAEEKTLDITVRPLLVDGKVKDFTTGDTHEVTEHQFVVRRAYRINDSLPDDTHKAAKWVWQRGGWILIDRRSGKTTLLKFPDFDPFYSQVSWYRDYAAYCGISSSGEEVTAVVAEIGARKPLYRKELGKNATGDDPESKCSAPHWERQPARVTFFPKVSEKFTVSVSGRVVEQTVDSESEE